MEGKRTPKRREERAGANLLDYDEFATKFSWAHARELLDGLPGGGLNIAYEAMDCHVIAGRGGKDRDHHTFAAVRRGVLLALIFWVCFATSSAAWTIIGGSAVIEIATRSLIPGDCL